MSHARAASIGLLLVATAAIANPPDSSRPLPPDVPLAAKTNGASLSPSHAQGITRCGLCHTTPGWSHASFDHVRTGFPLTGKHSPLGCRECHQAGFNTPIARSCVGCHRDAHRGELGQRCEGCHTTGSWESEFGADAHRRTNFPLSGRHAALPCSECHGEARDRIFTRSATPCVGCHLQQFLGTATSSSVNHVAFGFSQNCQECHDTFRFKPARFPQHDRCFPISHGEHSGIACLSCHSSLQGTSLSGTCNTNTAACSTCHTHSCSRMDEEHREVAGYACQDRKCYECHIRGGGR
jgi:hypothetical protein